VFHTEAGQLALQFVVEAILRGARVGASALRAQLVAFFDRVGDVTEFGIRS